MVFLDKKAAAEQLTPLKIDKMTKVLASATQKMSFSEVQ